MKKSKSLEEWDRLKAIHKNDLPILILEKYAKDLLQDGDGIAHAHKVFIEQYENHKLELIIGQKHMETAYLFWAFHEFYKMPALLNSYLSNFKQGKDSGTGSKFRNMEYEAMIALKFIEEGYTVTAIGEKHRPEYIIDNKFTIECKKPTHLSGLFINSVKASSQINNHKVPGIIIFNLDDIKDEMFVPSEKEFHFKIDALSFLVEKGLGTKRSYVAGFVLDFLDWKENTSKGALATATKSESGPLNMNRIYETVSKGLSGDLTLKFEKPVLRRSERVDIDRKLATEEYFNLNLRPEFERMIANTE